MPALINVTLFALIKAATLSDVKLKISFRVLSFDLQKMVASGNFQFDLYESTVDRKVYRPIYANVFSMIPRFQAGERFRPIRFTPVINNSAFINGVLDSC